jgi:hypothetical protein
LVGLAFFSVIRWNQCIFDRAPGAISPFSNFNLRKVNNLIDFGFNNGCLLTFGDYVEADTLDPTTNGMESRTEGVHSFIPDRELKWILEISQPGYKPVRHPVQMEEVANTAFCNRSY